MIFITEHKTGVVLNYYENTERKAAFKEIKDNGWMITKKIPLKGGDRVIYIKK